MTAITTTNWECILDDLRGDFHSLSPDIRARRLHHPDPPPSGPRAVTDLPVETLVARLEIVETGGRWIEVEHHDRFAALVRDVLS